MRTTPLRKWRAAPRLLSPSSPATPPISRDLSNRHRIGFRLRPLRRPCVDKFSIATLGGDRPEGAISIIGDQVQRIAAQGAGTLGFAFVSGLLVDLWSANSGVKALFDALNVAYEAEETRGFFRLNAVSLIFTISSVLLAVLGLSLAVIVPWVLDHFFFGLAFVGTIIRWLSVPLAIVVALVMLAVLFRFGPSIRKPLGAGSLRAACSRWLFFLSLPAPLLFFCLSFRQLQQNLR